MTRVSKKKTNPTTSNQLIINTCHSISIVNIITTLYTTVIPMIATFLHCIKLHLLEIFFLVWDLTQHFHVVNIKMNNDQCVKNKHYDFYKTH